MYTESALEGRECIDACNKQAESAQVNKACLECKCTSNTITHHS